MLNELRVLDLFCGMGGWSIPFLEDGDDVIGVDIEDNKYHHYPGPKIIQDIRTIDGRRFKDFDLIIGSPPCNEFSISKERSIGRGHSTRDIEKGLELIREFHRIVREAQPKFWAMENVTRLEHYIPDKPIWMFMVSKGGKRSLWGNLNIGLTPNYVFHRKIRDIGGWAKTRPLRAKIPYVIACMVRDAVKRR